MKIYQSNLLYSVFASISFTISPGVVTRGLTLENRSIQERFGPSTQSRALSTATMQRRGTDMTDHLRSRGNIFARADSGLQVYRSCSVPKSFALTFDDGPTEFSQQLDKGFEASPGSKASYFINGNNFGCIYDYADILLKRFNQGHLLASHTWSHPHLNQGNYEQISRQIDLLDQAMIKILGVKPLYFRPPFGEYNDLVLQVLREKGYKGLILWSDDSNDSSDPPPSVSDIVNQYQSLPEKTNILNHEGQRFMAEEVVPSIIPSLKSKNFNLVTVTECLELGSNPKDWYQFVQQPGTRDDSWTCAGTPNGGQFD